MNQTCGLAMTMVPVLLLGLAGVAGAEARTNTVVMLGDSTTLCANNDPGAKLTDLVQAYLTQSAHLQVVVINSGVGGDTAKGGYARLEGAVFAHAPDLVTISFGLNDTGLLTPAEYEKWMTKIVEAIQQESRAKILLVTSTPFNNERHGWAAQFKDKGGLDQYMDAHICAVDRALASKNKLPLCDLHHHFQDKFKEQRKLIDKLILPDGVHLTNEGNKVAAEYLAPMLAKLLAR